MDLEILHLIASELDRIAPSDEETSGIMLAGLGAAEVLAVLRTVPDGAGEEAIQAAIEALVRRKYPDILA